MHPNLQPDIDTNLTKSRLKGVLIKWINSVDLRRFYKHVGLAVHI